MKPCCGVKSNNINSNLLKISGRFVSKDEFESDMFNDEDFCLEGMPKRYRVKLTMKL